MNFISKSRRWKFHLGSRECFGKIVVDFFRVVGSQVSGYVHREFMYEMRRNLAVPVKNAGNTPPFNPSTLRFVFSTSWFGK